MAILLPQSSEYQGNRHMPLSMLYEGLELSLELGVCAGSGIYCLLIPRGNCIFIIIIIIIIITIIIIIDLKHHTEELQMSY